MVESQWVGAVNLKFIESHTRDETGLGVSFMCSVQRMNKLPNGNETTV